MPGLSTITSLPARVASMQIAAHSCGTGFAEKPLARRLRHVGPAPCHLGDDGPRGRLGGEAGSFHAGLKLALDWVENLPMVYRDHREAHGHLPIPTNSA
jgi:hypothetical protein